MAGAPTTNGSNHPSEDLTGSEGLFIQRLRRAGCVILGKTKTAEFAFSPTGENTARGTPRNPFDLKTHRWPGGSSSGSGVAMGAGLAAFAIGSDTGGSIRIPAALNGVVGHKTTIGHYPTAGVFPLSPTLDTVGALCRTAADAALIHAALDLTDSAKTPAPNTLAGVVFGRPTVAGSHWFEHDLEPAVDRAFGAALEVLKDAGANIVDVDLGAYGIDPSEREKLFPAVVAPELVGALGVSRFVKAQEVMDAKTAARAGAGLNVSAVEHAQALRRIRELAALADAAFRESGCDAWITPTVKMVAGTVAELDTDHGTARGALCNRNTQPCNLFGQCAVTLPLPTEVGLPAGLQLMFRAGGDSQGLALACTVENALPAPLRPKLR